MEAIQAEMQKHFKTTAKKKLYFALAVMFHEAREQIVTNAENCDKLLNLAQEESAPPEMKKAALMSLAPMVMSVRPVFCMVHALKEYKAAMGEYPEFTKFMIDGGDEKLERAIEKTMGIIDATQKMLDVFSTKGNKAPNLKAGAFGEDFVKQCEKIKLKGE